MDLDIDVLAVPTRATPVLVSVIREIRDADVVLFHQQTSVVQRGMAIKRLRDSHHRLAKLLASGVSVIECSLITGYSVARIRGLQHDPMFRELIAFYKENDVKEYNDFHGSLAGLARDAVQELHQRLDETPEQMSNDFLRDLIKDMADRTGFAPVSKNVNVNVSTQLADRLGRARARANAIDIEEVSTREPRPVTALTVFDEAAPVPKAAWGETVDA